MINNALENMTHINHITVVQIHP